MTEADRLNQKINELKQWQTVAWRRIADPGLTPFEGRDETIFGKPNWPCVTI
jgi:hypothetical protein